MKDFILLSAYTLDSGYEKEVQNLIKSCDAVGIKQTDIVGYKARGTWERNCQYKAELIQEKIKEYKKPVVWVDADAVFRKYPDLFHTLDCDVAAHLRPKHLLSGTLYFDHTPKAIAVIDAWVNAHNNDPKVWDQRSLQTIVQGSHKNLIKFESLPASYCKIFDLMAKEVKDPVIEHFQASRKFKRTMSRKTAPKQTTPRRPRPTPRATPRPLKKRPMAAEHLAVLRRHSLQLPALANYFKGKKVIVVGNSKSLMENDHAELIDSYDCVVRMNHGIPHKLTGKKTGLWVCNYTQYTDAVVLSQHRKFKPAHILRFGLSQGKLFPTTMAKATHFVEGPALKPLLEPYLNLKRPLQPSTGVKTIFYLLNHVGVAKLDIIGFDFFKTGTWYNKRSTAGSKSHNGILDEEYAQSQVDVGRVTIL